MIKIDDYRAVAPPGAVDVILKLAERVQGRRFLHLSGGRFGGGAAEMLRTMVPILADLGLDAGWEITGAIPHSMRPAARSSRRSRAPSACSPTRPSITTSR